MNKIIQIAALLSLLLGFASAQISVSPLIKRIEIGQAGPAQTTFSVYNGSAEPVRFRASFSGFTFQNNVFTLIAPDEVNENDLSPFLRAAPLEFTVPARSEQSIRVIALVPPSAAVREMRGALVVEPLFEMTQAPLPEEAQGSVTGTVQYVYRFVAQIYASQPGGGAALELGEASYSSENALQLGFANSGMISAIASTTWVLTQGEKTVLEGEEPARYIVLPENTRTAILAENLELEPGEYTLTGTFGVEDGGEPPVVLNPQPFTKTFTVK